jgi:hypothetical protein
MQGGCESEGKGKVFFPEEKKKKTFMSWAAEAYGPWPETWV